MTEVQGRLAGGQKVSKSADDPLAMAQILNLNQEVNRTECYISNANYAKQSLSYEESILASMGDLLQGIRFSAC